VAGAGRRSRPNQQHFECLAALVDDGDGVRYALLEDAREDMPHDCPHERTNGRTITHSLGNPDRPVGYPTEYVANNPTAW
jgi:hypothetical protein